MKELKVTFGIIVLNGEPFTRYNLRSLYPFAHQIIVVEGATPGAVDIASSDGHSSDGTLEVLRRFKEEEDHEDKLIIVTAEDERHSDGFWPGEKNEMSQAYAKRATGDYLWQIDIDEFYKEEDIWVILEMLEHNPGITAVSFPMLTIWGSLNYLVDGWYLRRGSGIYHRLFKWGPGYRYVSHRPPTVIDEEGRNLRDLNWVKGKELARQGIYLCHYSLLFPKQVREKCLYYQKADWALRDKAIKWFEEDYLSLRHPFRVHNVYDYPSWLERFEGSHPHQVLEMMEDIKRGKHDVVMRNNEDVEHLLSLFMYRLGRWFFRTFDYVDRFLRFLVAFVRKSIKFSFDKTGLIKFLDIR